MDCPACNASLNADDQFCTECGAPAGAPADSAGATRFCTECGTRCEPGIRFCTECGASVETPAVGPATEAVRTTTPTATQPAPAVATAPERAQPRSAVAAPTPPPAPRSAPVAVPQQSADPEPQRATAPRPIPAAAASRTSPTPAAAEPSAAAGTKKLLLPVLAVLVIAGGSALYFLVGNKSASPSAASSAPRAAQASVSASAASSTPAETSVRPDATHRFESALARADVRSAGIDAIPIVQASPLLDQLAASTAGNDPQTASSASARLSELPKVPHGARAAARKANDRGIAALRANDNVSAVAALRDAVRADPSDVEVIDNLGYAYNLSGDLEAAEFWARVALAVSPTRSSAWLNLGIAAGQQGDETTSLGAMLLAHKYSGRPDRTIKAIQDVSGRENSTPEMRSAATRALDALPR